MGGVVLQRWGAIQYTPMPLLHQHGLTASQEQRAQHQAVAGGS